MKLLIYSQSGIYWWTWLRGAHSTAYLVSTL